ncbi:MAG: glutamine--fructose-6-phosphate transaminase (isomerizing) [Thermodesulfobacteriota bacterium]
MCGIVGYVGPRQAVPVLVEGLKRLEYRGYDSAGVVFLHGGELVRQRCQGKLVNLEEALEGRQDLASHIGLGHTRWATHGAPTEANAHPHSDCTGRLVVVHNGIIENYHSLREELKGRGHVFASETDTEVVAHLVEEALAQGLALAAAVRQALGRVDGSYAVGVLWQGAPDRLIAARNQSPLVLGVKEGGGAFMASDVPALLPYTREVLYLDDQEMAELSADRIAVSRLADGIPVDKPVQHIDWNAAMAEKAGFKHFMLKEIFEQPQAVQSTLRGRLNPETGLVDLSEIGLPAEVWQRAERVCFVACGTSWHAALVGKYWIERWARLPVEVDIASEFRYRSLVLDERVITVPISQSGETADTLAGMRLAKRLGSPILAICNVVGSTMTREADGTLYTHAGPEIGVASTKAFTSQLAALALLALQLAQVRGTLSREEQRVLVHGLVELPAILEQELPRIQAESQALARAFADSRDFLYLGRGLHFPIALEGALKLKEISYIHAEGYAAGEMKHGPIALIDRDMPVLTLAPRDAVYEKVISNVEEVRSRHGRIILIGSAGDTALARISEHVLLLPVIQEALTPILATIPLQLLAYEIATLRGCDVDQPRNLAKSVTVE